MSLKYICIEVNKVQIIIINMSIIMTVILNYYQYFFTLFLTFIHSMLIYLCIYESLSKMAAGSKTALPPPPPLN